MRTEEAVLKFKVRLSAFYGYDESLNYIGGSEAPASVKPAKAFLAPRDFLDFAVDDSTDLNKERSLVNCLGNCKRAIDSQVDCLIGRLGMFPLAKRQGWNIPTKLEFISKSGLVAPRILRKVNTLRNRLEHDHAVPSKEQVEDALDIATLFVSYAELVRIPSMNWTLPDGLSVRYDYDEMIFKFFDKDPSDLADGEKYPACSLAYGEDLFQDFYDFLIKNVPSMARERQF
jgi:hypothetical protein